MDARATGVSFHDRIAARHAVKKSTVDIVFVRYNASALGLSSDFWQPVVTDHYRFALTPHQVNGVLCSPDTPRQVDALCRAVEKGPLDAEEEQYLVDLATLAEGRAVLAQ